MKKNISKCVLVGREIIERTLSGESTQGNRALEPLKSFAKDNGLPFIVIEDNNVFNEAEIHNRTNDLLQCLEGEAAFIYGGKLINPRTESEGELRAKAISGGTEVVLKPGDWIWVPAGISHQHGCDGVVRLLVIKIPGQL